MSARAWWYIVTAARLVAQIEVQQVGKYERVALRQHVAWLQHDKRKAARSAASKGARRGGEHNSGRQNERCKWTVTPGARSEAGAPKHQQGSCRPLFGTERRGHTQQCCTTVVTRAGGQKRKQFIWNEPQYPRLFLVYTKTVPALKHPVAPLFVIVIALGTVLFTMYVGSAVPRAHISGASR